MDRGGREQEREGGERERDIGGKRQTLKFLHSTIQ